MWNDQELLNSAEAGNETRVEELLAMDSINVNYQNSYSWSPLHAAAWCGHDHIIRLLHQAGADLEIRDRQGCCGVLKKFQDTDLTNFIY